jgi:sporulation protein YlmC with PRC-barrel domain
MVRNSIRPKTLLTATAVALVISGGAWAQAAQDTGKAAPTTEAAPIQPDKTMNGPAPAGPAAQGPAVQAPGAPATAAQGDLPKSPPAASPAPAVQPSPPPAQAATGPAPAEPAATETAGQPPEGGIIAAQRDGQELTSDVVGAKVASASGENLGKVADLIVGRDGKVAGAVLSVGGFLGIGDKHVAVPWNALTARGPDQPLVVAMTKTELEAAPEFATLADQRAQRQAALTPAAGAVPAPGAGSQ